MPRVRIKLLTSSDPDLDDVLGSSATLRFPEPMKKLITIDDLLKYLAATPNASHTLIRAIQILHRRPAGEQNTLENPVPPEA